MNLYKTYTLLTGDAQERLKSFSTNSIDACITDPPYGINMANWDSALPHKEIWSLLFNVLKPGSFFLCFCAPRLYHRLATSIEDAGFEIKDMMFWLTTTKLAKPNALKPVHEPILIAQKPLSGSLKENLNLWGTGKINLNENRIPWKGKLPTGWYKNGYSRIAFGDTEKNTKKSKSEEKSEPDPNGRLPSNIVGHTHPLHQDYFFDPQWTADDNEYLIYYYSGRSTRKERGEDNIHPTPKPLLLMQYLIKLFSQVNQTILDPFSGSGSTGLACLKENRHYVGIEISSEYNEIAERRLKNLIAQRSTLSI